MSTVELMQTTGPTTAVPQTQPEDLQEHGVAGTENFGGTVKHDDPNPQWDDFQSAVKMCDQMRRMDSQVRAVTQVIKQPLLSATWKAQAPEDGDPVDQQIAEFV